MPHTPPNPSLLSRKVSTAEILADGIVHALAILAGLIAFPLLLGHALGSVGTGVFAALTVYAAGFFLMWGFSMAYNMTPPSALKWLLRRFDHSAIYILIAATYTPIISQIKDQMFALALLAGVWGVALVGILLKLFKPGKFDKLSVGLYLAMGWSGLIAYEHVIETLPNLAMWFLAAGGALYTLGVIFHAWRRLRFQNAIWHSFVLIAAACHYVAVMDLVLAA